jgi:hypothetical protein
MANSDENYQLIESSILSKLLQKDAITIKEPAYQRSLHHLLEKEKAKAKMLPKAIMS